MKITVPNGRFLQLAEEVESMKGTILELWHREKIATWNNLNGQRWQSLHKRRWKITTEHFEVEDFEGTKRVVMERKKIYQRDGVGNIIIESDAAEEQEATPKLLEGKTVEQFNEAIGALLKELVEINV